MIAASCRRRVHRVPGLAAVASSCSMSASLLSARVSPNHIDIDWFEVYRLPEQRPGLHSAVGPGSLAARSVRRRRLGL